MARSRWARPLLIGVTLACAVALALKHRTFAAARAAVAVGGRARGAARGPPATWAARDARPSHQRHVPCRQPASAGWRRSGRVRSPGAASRASFAGRRRNLLGGGGLPGWPRVSARRQLPGWRPDPGRHREPVRQPLLAVAAPASPVTSGSTFRRWSGLRWRSGLRPRPGFRRWPRRLWLAPAGGVWRRQRHPERRDRLREGTWRRHDRRFEPEHRRGGHPVRGRQRCGLGGFSGREEHGQRGVDRNGSPGGRLRWVINDGAQDFRAHGDTRTGSEQALSIVAKTCRQVNLRTSRGASSTMYDCTGRAAAIAAAADTRGK